MIWMPPVVLQTMTYWSPINAMWNEPRFPAIAERLLWTLNACCGGLVSLGGLSGLKDLIYPALP
jgi:hypothetical protein